MSIDRIIHLIAVGVGITPETEWIGEVGTDQRQQVTIPDTVISVFIPFTPAQWVAGCSREGSMYLGGCCGTLGYVQDVLNNIFRDGGFVDNPDFYSLGQQIISHGDFEAFSPMDDDKFLAYIDNWDNLDMWEQLGIIYNGVVNVLKPRDYDLKADNKSIDELNEDDVIRRFYRLISYLDFADLFTEDTMPEEIKSQHEATKLLQRAKLLPLTKKLLEFLEASSIDFNGYAIIDIDTNNIYSMASDGDCLYTTTEAAQTVINQWTKWGLDRVLKSKIVPVSITVADGLKFL